MSVTARRLRPISRWISWVRPLWLPLGRLPVDPLGARPGEQRVLGGDPPLARAPHPAGHVLVDAGRAQHPRAAGRTPARSRAAMTVKSRSKVQRAQLIGARGRRSSPPRPYGPRASGQAWTSRYGARYGSGIPNRLGAARQPARSRPRAPTAMWWCVQGNRLLVGDGRRLPDRSARPPGDGIDRPGLFLGMLDGRPSAGPPTSARRSTSRTGSRSPICGPLHPLLGERRWTIAGRAVQLVDWEHTHRFCGRCADPDRAVAGRAGPPVPLVRAAGLPRLAPAVITLVDARRRGAAGPGRQLRRADVQLHRRVRRAGRDARGGGRAGGRARRSGVEVGDVRYQASQPWPFPHSLMIGFRAEWVGG